MSISSKDSLLPPPSHPQRVAGMWWLADAVGAVIAAAGLALAIGARVGGARAYGALAGGALSHHPALLILGGGAVRALALARAPVAGQIAAMDSLRRIRARLQAALLPSRLSRGRLVGEDMQLAVSSVEAVEGLVSRFQPLRRAAMLSPLLIALAVAPASYVAAAILLATLLPYGLAMALAGGAARRAADAQHAALSRLSGLFVDRVRSLPAILAFGAEGRIARHLGEAARDLAERTLAVLRIAFASSAILEFFAALSVALVAVYCGFTLLSLLPFLAPERIDLPRAFFALALAPEFYLGMRRLAVAYHEKQQGEAALAAISTELARTAPPPPPMEAPGMRLEGRGVVLRHADGEPIGPLDWQWRGPGLHAITGPTGAGKSSLLLGLIGQVPLTEGEVLAGGSGFVPGALNPHIGWAGQQVALLPGSLRDNLALSGVPAGDGEMLRWLDRLGLGPLLARRGGLDMAVDHRGSGLSGGERRRIGLVRAILSRRPILLLDEPTADLDAATADRLRDALAELARERLVAAATHDARLAAMACTLCEIRP